MQVSLQASALAVSAIYYLWRDVYAARRLRDFRLRQRVAYLLWAAALHDLPPAKPSEPAAAV
jgi:hypothetical protein